MNCVVNADDTSISVLLIKYVIGNVNDNVGNSVTKSSRACGNTVKTNVSIKVFETNIINECLNVKNIKFNMQNPRQYNQ